MSILLFVLRLEVTEGKKAMQHLASEM